jgi:hypothetical protein
MNEVFLNVMWVATGQHPPPRLFMFLFLIFCSPYFSCIHNQTAERRSPLPSFLQKGPNWLHSLIHRWHRFVCFIPFTHPIPFIHSFTHFCLLQMCLPVPPTVVVESERLGLFGWLFVVRCSTKNLPYSPLCWAASASCIDVGL